MNNKSTGWVDGKSPDELVWGLMHAEPPGSQMHEQIKGALALACTKQVTHAIDSFSNSMSKGAVAAQRLSNMLLVLNILLGLFTIAGTVLAVVQFVRS